jgi:hypothetical protein
VKRTIIESLHLVAGLIGTALIASLSAWAVPNQEDTIWTVAVGAMVIVAFMAVRPLRLAWRADREAAQRQHADG